MAGKPATEKLEAYFRSYLRFLEAGQQVCLGELSKQTSRLCHLKCRLKPRNLSRIFWVGWRGLLKRGWRNTSFLSPERREIKPF